jgi:hypothetical protein
LLLFFLGVVGLRRLANTQRWAPKAHERAERASKLAERLRQETKAHRDTLYRRINDSICEHDRNDAREWRLQHQSVVKAMKTEADADLAERWCRYERVRDREDREETRYTRYCLEQCELLRALRELAAKERAMYELANGKDQCMTVMKLALAKLGMWVREQYFPATYAHATWHRLVPFFRVQSRVTEGKQAVWVEVRPFNGRQLNRDLRVVWERVTATQPILPAGRRLCLSIAGTKCLSADGQRCKLA